jgi:hypothetical protein
MNALDRALFIINYNWFTPKVKSAKQLNTHTANALNSHEQRQCAYTKKTKTKTRGENKRENERDDVSLRTLIYFLTEFILWMKLMNVH